MLIKYLGDIASPDLSFAWRTFTMDATSKNILSLPTSSRPGTLLQKYMLIDLLVSLVRLTKIQKLFFLTISLLTIIH